MRRDGTTDLPRASSEALLSGQNSDYTAVTTSVSSDLARSTLGPDQHVDRAAGLAVTFCGEEVPASAGVRLAQGPRPAALPFELAAVLCGHDPTTPAGASDARHDYQVWDLVGGAR